MENNTKLWGEIQRFTKVFPKKAADGKLYVYFKFISHNLKVPGKRKALVNFSADCYATGAAWQFLKEKSIYPGKAVQIDGYFDEALGNKAFRVLVLDYEDVTKHLQPQQAATFHPTMGFSEAEFAF